MVHGNGGGPVGVRVGDDVSPFDPPDDPPSPESEGAQLPDPPSPRETLSGGEAARVLT